LSIGPIDVSTNYGRLGSAAGVWDCRYSRRNSGCLGSCLGSRCSCTRRIVGVWDRPRDATRDEIVGVWDRDEIVGVWDRVSGIALLPGAWNRLRSRATARRSPAAELGAGGDPAGVVEHPVARVRPRRAARPPGDAPARSGRVRSRPHGRGLGAARLVTLRSRVLIAERKRTVG
jgi:hypothetical protein